jgi:polyribonucleotide nucleotidyltransferase
MEKIVEKIEINGRELIIETGELARQAQGSVIVKYGETVVLAACCVADARDSFGFFPLTVDYRERTYAAGKIPGGFFKREGRPHEKEIITSRLIDRPIRPLFPDGYKDEIQLSLTVLSSDGENDPDIPAMIAGSCAIALTQAPFEGPVGAVRMGRVNGEFVVNPTFAELETSEFELIVAGTEQGITMLEGESLGTSEDIILASIEAAKAEISKLVDLQNKIVAKAGKPKKEFAPVEIDAELKEKITAFAQDKILDVLRAALSKEERSERISVIKDEIMENFGDTEGEDQDKNKQVSAISGKLSKELLRKLVTEEGLRVDGRKPNELRPITVTAGILPRTHGSGTFTKGETQSLSVVTLGTKSDEQIMDVLEGEYRKSFMLHYNFPAFAVGEVRPNRGPGRREIGHGLLAEKGLAPSLPEKDDFPYTIRLVSDILESNGSSSMATVCAGTIALMDAGIPLKDPVAGVGMGIINGVILTDMLGDEDHAGDMDFKIVGTRTGVTAIQMDIKIYGISIEVLTEALEQAKQARIGTLDKMAEVIAQPKKELSQYAPQLISITINPDKIGTLIGPGGKNIKAIQESTESRVEIDDDGTVTVSADSKENLDAAVALVEGCTAEAEPGKIYEGIVKSVVDFGAFVEILPGKDGLVHISELAPFRVEKVEDIVKVGDKVKVKCIGVDDRGRIKLSRSKALDKKEEEKDNG